MCAIICSQNAIYANVHDETLKAAVRSAKTPEDALDSGTLAAEYKILTEELDKKVLADTAGTSTAVLVEMAERGQEDRGGCQVHVLQVA